VTPQNFGIRSNISSKLLQLETSNLVLSRHVQISEDWLIEHGLTSAPTQHRLYGRRFLQVKRPNQQYQSAEGDATNQWRPLLLAPGYDPLIVKTWSLSALELVRGTPMCQHQQYGTNYCLTTTTSDFSHRQFKAGLKPGFLIAPRGLWEHPFKSWLTNLQLDSIKPCILRWPWVTSKSHLSYFNVIVAKSIRKISDDVCVVPSTAGLWLQFSLTSL